MLRLLNNVKTRRKVRNSAARKKFNAPSQLACYQLKGKQRNSKRNFAAFLLVTTTKETARKTATREEKSQRTMAAYQE
jgi:hypothetical protein